MLDLIKTDQKNQTNKQNKTKKNNITTFICYHLYLFTFVCYNY